MSDFSVLKRAGISVADAAKLFGVCRATAHSWVNGGPAQSTYLLERAKKLCVGIESAVNKGLFPLIGVKRSEKLGVIRRVISAEMRS